MPSYREDLGFLCANAAGKIPSQRLRKCIYRHIYGMKIGVQTAIYHSCEIRGPRNITIGDYSSIGDHCILDGRRGLTIGTSVNLSTGVWIWTEQHDPQDLQFGCNGGPVVVEDYAWLSCRTTILPGVRIGRGAVVAAGAVVTKDVEAFSIVAGVPARKIGERPHELNYRLGCCVHFW
jgi:acetyltransferase-like isoleucine patch superfamily enzyme